VRLFYFFALHCARSLCNQTLAYANDMRKVRSAPQLAAMDVHAAALPATVAGSPRHMPCGLTSHGVHRQGPWKVSVELGCLTTSRLPFNVSKRHTCISHELSLQNAAAGYGPTRSRGTSLALRRSASPVHRLQALMLDNPPAPPPNIPTPDLISEAVEQADELIEEFVWARGLIPAGECFEQFGWTESAPPLKDIRQPVTEDQRQALASCLATPFMYENEHHSRQAQESVSNRSQENERRLTNRYPVLLLVVNPPLQSSSTAKILPTQYACSLSLSLLHIACHWTDNKAHVQVCRRGEGAAA